MVMEKKRKINGRAVASLFMLFSFISLVPSGIALHIAADGGFKTAEHITMTIHNASALIFLISAVIHIVFNWKITLSYMKAKTTGYRKFSKETIIAILGVIVLLSIALLHIAILG
jgi:hypothetical protein